MQSLNLIKLTKAAKLTLSSTAARRLHYSITDHIKEHRRKPRRYHRPGKR